MDEDISIINSNTRNEKIKNFFVANKKVLFLSILLIVVLFLSYFGFQEYKEKKRILISDQYNRTIIEYSSNSQENTKNSLVDPITCNHQNSHSSSRVIPPKCSDQ